MGFVFHSLDISPHSLYNIRCMRMLVNHSGFSPKWHRSVGDLLVLLLAVLGGLVLLLWRPGETGQICYISWDGGETTLSLLEPTTLSLESRGVLLTIVVEDGVVRVAESTCPDALCQAAGELRQAGEMLVCVPAGVVIRIPQAANENGEDAIVG